MRESQRINIGLTAPKHYVCRSRCGYTEGMDPQELTSLAATIDLDRRRRCGFPEVVFGPGKTIEQLRAIVTALIEHGEPVLATRIDAEQAAGFLAAFPDGRYNEVARTFRVDGARRSSTLPWPLPKREGEMWRSFRPARAICRWPRRPARRSIGWASA